MYFVSILRYVYIILHSKKNINTLQIYLYNINIYFRLGFEAFQGAFDNIYALFIFHRVQKISTSSERVIIHDIQIEM